MNCGDLSGFKKIMEQEKREGKEKDGVLRWGHLALFRYRETGKVDVWRSCNVERVESEVWS